MTFPNTYYQSVKALDPGTVYTVSIEATGDRRITVRKYFDLSYCGDEATTEEDLADELAAAMRRAVRRRTLPRFGRTAVALSGGLDSRAILAAIENRDQTFAFSCYNEPNRELQIAESIAASAGVPFFPWRRDFEYYGDTAELGVRISGGMGTFANNHFLGIIDQLHAEGADNLLTGCYCDYLFKGLPLNRHRNKLTGREEIGPFRHEFYFDQRQAATALGRQARERCESRVPPELRSDRSDAGLFALEVLRSFPLAYEGDNQQRLVPQRVTGWSVPMADREILEVYRRIPARYKLNRSLFLKTVHALCPPELLRIPDANTGTAINAGAVRRLIARQTLRAQRTWNRLRPSIATDESWPNWPYYVRHSQTLARLWQRPNPDATDLLTKLVGPGNIRPHPVDYVGDDLFVFVSLLTLKLWLEQRS